MPKYKVKDGHSITYGADKAGVPGNKDKIANPGDVVELSVEDAAKMPWALEISEKEAEKLEKLAEKAEEKKK